MALTVLEEFARKQDEERQSAIRLAIPWIGADQIFADLPPYPWLIPGLHIAPGRITLLCGYADVGKTVIAMSVALAVASGKSVWGVFKPARVGPVLHLNGEIGSYLARERYQRLTRGMNLGFEDLVKANTLRLATYPPVRLDDEDFEEKLRGACEGVALVVIDSLRAFSGAIDENSKEIGIALLMLARVSEATGATILVLHHNRKPSKDDDPEAAKMSISGNSSILGGSECAFVMQAKKRGPITVKHERSPLGKYMDDFGLRIEDVERDGNRRWALRVAHMEGEELVRKEAEAAVDLEASSTQKAMRQIVEKLALYQGSFRGSRSELLGLMRGDRNTLSRALTAMTNDGAVRREGDYHHPVWVLTRGNPVSGIGSV